MDATSQRLLNATTAIRQFRFRASIDDVDEQLAMANHFRHLLIEVKYFAKYLPEPLRSELQALDFDEYQFGAASEVHSLILAMLDDLDDIARAGPLRKPADGGSIPPPAAPTRSLHQILRSRDLSGLDIEFERALGNVEKDPPTAVTSACAIVEALCKVYIEDEGLELPSNQTVKPLWKTVQKHLGLDPAQLADNDLKSILTGLASIVEGLGAFRTHVGSAHGRGRLAYRPAARHARLAAHSAHSLVAFVLETWDERKRSKSPQ